jgi:predicted transcriptional regulator
MDSLREGLLEEIVQLERRLQEARLALEPEPHAGTRSGPLLIDEDKVRRVLAARRIRERQLGEDLFADPAWDLLLEAFAADLGQKHLTVAALCLATNVPQSVAIRWIKKLEQDGWLHRSRALEERQSIELTPRGSVRLRRYFEGVGSALLLV